jgi:acetyl esterase/lipase
VRDSAQAWGVNPYDVGIMGFSAGGHLASSVSTHADWAVRPNFTILFYPVVTMGEGTHKGSRDNFLGGNRDASNWCATGLMRPRYAAISLRLL